MRFLGGEHTLEHSGTDGIVASEIDGSDTGTVAFIDIEEHTDPAIRGRFSANRDSDIGVAGLAISSLDGLHVGSNASLRINAAHGNIDHRIELVVVEAAIAIEPDRRDLSALGNLRLRLGYTQDHRSIPDERRNSEKRRAEEDAVQKLG